jgi:hypothetical protein
MGEKQNQPSEFSFNTYFRVDLQGSRVTPEGAGAALEDLRVVIDWLAAMAGEDGWTAAGIGCTSGRSGFRGRVPPK